MIGRLIEYIWLTSQKTYARYFVPIALTGRYQLIKYARTCLPGLALTRLGCVLKVVHSCANGARFISVPNLMKVSSIISPDSITTCPCVIDLQIFRYGMDRWMYLDRFQQIL